MSTYTDDFNRADAGTLGANWVDLDAGFGIVSNAAQGGSGEAVSYYNAVVGDDQYSKVVWIGNGNVHSVGVRIGAGPVGYFLSFLAGGTEWRIKINGWAGSGADIAGGTTTAPVATDVIEIRAVGTTISAYKNGVLLGSGTDSTYTSGRVGIGGYLVDVPAFDSWEGGDFEVAPTVTSV